MSHNLMSAMDVDAVKAPRFGGQSMQTIMTIGLDIANSFKPKDRAAEAAPRVRMTFRVNCS
jgi:hypothetical protein